MSILALKLNLPICKERETQNNRASRPSFGKNYAAFLGKVSYQGDVFALKMGIKKVVNLPCAYCGAPMLTKSLLEKMLESCAMFRGEALGDLLNKLSFFMTAGRRTLIHDLIDGTKKHPESTLNELIDIKGGPKKDAFIQEQQKILNLLKEKYAQFYSPEDRDRYNKLISCIIEGLPNQFGEHGFRPIETITKFIVGYPRSILNTLPKDEVQRFRKTVDSLKVPLSKEDIFYMRYFDASPQLALRRLANGCLSSIEHIKPQKSGGGDELGNLIAVCKSCNYNRVSKPLSEFAEEHPDIKSSMVKQFEYIRKFFAFSLDGYLSKISKTIMSESEGKIDLTEYIK